MSDAGIAAAADVVSIERALAILMDLVVVAERRQLAWAASADVLSTESAERDTTAASGSGECAASPHVVTLLRYRRSQAVGLARVKSLLASQLS